MPSPTVTLRLSGGELAALDAARGATSRTDWIREAIRERAGQSPPNGVRAVTPLVTTTQLRENVKRADAADAAPVEPAPLRPVNRHMTRCGCPVCKPPKAA